MKKKLLMISALVAALSAGSAFAMPGGKDCDRGFGMGKHGGPFKAHHMDPEEMLARELSKDQVRTLMEARLIMKGNENLKVGKVSSTRSGFEVSIVTRDDSLVEELELAKNGMPLKKYERLQERLEKRRAQQNDD
ncbi:hypothetical protein R50073_47500 [Maricurvus nonylphenolicus]|uniref:hypothetical protein n=1 Tax=Maricurvus nonylphenolicus TaxID=1008307 RepID=UPI0036F357C5